MPKRKQAWEDDDEIPDNDLAGLVAWLIIIFVVGLLIWCCQRFACCCCCCCRRSCPSLHQRFAPAEPDRGAAESATVKVDGKDMPVDLLVQKKELWTTYLLWISAGLTGAHHFYLDRLVHGVLSMLTLNFLLCGWMLDALMIPFYVRGFNSRTAGSARHDASCRHICLRLPMVMTIWACVVSVGITKTPRILHSFSVVDLDRDIAKTKENPYSMLGASPGDDSRTLARAYQEQKRKVQRSPSSPCDRKCKEQLAELQKAYQFTANMGWKQELAKEREEARANEEAGKKSKRRPRSKRRKVPTHDDQAEGGEWSDWTDFVGLEWKVVSDRTQQGIEYLGESFESWTGSRRRASSTGDEEL
mmetsp:Transcript_5447/g.10377  ORF Transcript_5447/g.10377 Transcript_5447/m.10377 type:complete len:359 (-) Transcript_5447:50-1126(-)